MPVVTPETAGLKEIVTIQEFPNGRNIVHSPVLSQEEYDRRMKLIKDACIRMEINEIERKERITQERKLAEDNGSI